MQEEIQIILGESDVVAAIEAYLNQQLFRIRVTVTVLEVRDNGNGSDFRVEIIRESTDEDHAA